MAEREKLSCYIRTKNEERMIGDVVEAAFKVADEVVVIDSLSTDRTVEIAEGKGARVIVHEWLGLGRQKRLGEEAAHHDWLLDLDADEIVSDELAESIRAVLVAPRETAYALKLTMQPPGRPLWVGFFDVPRAKLYDRRVHRQPDDPSWDQLPSVRKRKLTALDGPLIHHAFPDIRGLVDKMNSGSSSDAKSMKMRPMWELRTRIVIGFPFFFLRQYLWKSGWRGGIYGFAMCVIIAWSRWMRDVKQYEAATWDKSASRDG